ncbi:MAG: DUF892 family protein [Chryseobacterium sp.]|nr:DUF892 family protein [Chryseobacterium sp.]
MKETKAINFQERSAVKSNNKNQISKTLMNLFIDDLEDIYWVEKCLVQTLPKIYDDATDLKLKCAIKKHLERTLEQVKRLDVIFESLKIKVKVKKCKPIDLLINDSDINLKTIKSGAVKDASIIAVSQKIKHYEIASYGILAAFAKSLKQNSALELLLLNLEVQKKSNAILTAIADDNLNLQAALENLD